MQKWEYLFAVTGNDLTVSTVNGRAVNSSERVEWSAFAQEKGKEGWELVSASETSVNYTLYFKRHKP
jgi:hypothetical protein